MARPSVPSDPSASRHGEGERSSGVEPRPVSELRLGAVVSTYHAELTRAMLASARRTLLAAGLRAESLVVLEVGGAFELPLVARRLAVREDIDAVLCFGLVLKGETSHDVYIAQSVAAGLQQAALEADKPVLFGVLTCDTLDQARQRATGSHDKGAEVARAALAAVAAMDAAPVVGRPAGRASRAGFLP